MSDGPAWIEEFASEHGAEAAWERFRASSPEERREVVVALKAHVDRLSRSEPAAALSASEALVELAREVPELEALARRGRAGALHFAGRHAEARPELERAVELYASQGAAIDQARALRSLVEVLHLSGEAREALGRADQARALLADSGEEELLAQLEVNVGNVHARLDEHDLASRHYALARDRFVALGHSMGTAICEFNLGEMSLAAGRLDAAESSWNRAAEVFADLGHQLHSAECAYKLALVRARRGDFVAALRDLAQARERFEAVGHPAGSGYCDLCAAEVLLALDAPGEALERAMRADAVFRENELELEGGRARLLGSSAAARTGRGDEAAALLEGAEETFARLGSEALRAVARLHRALNAIGVPGSGTGVLEATRAELEDRQQEALADVATLAIARRALAGGAPDRALRELDGLLGREADGRATDALVELDALVLRSRCLGEAGAGDDAALPALRAAVASIDASYARVPGADLRMGFFRSRHEVFRDLAWLLSGRDDPRAATEAVLALDRGRLRSFRDRDRTPVLEGDAQRDVRERLDWLLARRADAEFGRGSGREDEAIGSVPTDAELDEARAAVRALGEGADREAAPAWTPLVADSLRAIARACGVLVSYLWTPDGARALVCDGDGVEVVPLPDAGRDLGALRTKLRLELSHPALRAAERPASLARRRAAVERVLDALGERLLGPLAHVLDAPRLVVVPHGALHGLPFHLLRRDGVHVVERAAVSYAMSIASLARPSTDDARPPRSVDLLVGRTAGLAGVEREAARLHARYGARLRPIEAPAAAPPDSPGGAILHIASHAFHLPDDPDFSGIQCADSFLLARDLMAMRLDYQLVVMNGCETAQWRGDEAEDVLGLTRAFLAAGARAVVGAQWPVRDPDAEEFSDRLHAHLDRDLPAIDALATTQRELRDSRPHPAYWGAYTLTGTP